MKYQWLEDIPTAEELGNELGCKVKSITRGMVVVGYKDVIDEEGKPAQLPITRKGIEIEFEKEPGNEKLHKLDMKLTGLKREGGKDLVKEFEELKSKVDKLHSK